MHYKIVEASSAKELAGYVNNGIECGFTIMCGGVYSDEGVRQGRAPRFYQAVIDPQYETNNKAPNGEPLHGTKFCV